MKKLLFFFCITGSVLTVSCHGNTNKKEAVAMPESVLTSFHQKYPDAKDVDWKQEQKKDTTLFDGTFTNNGKKVTVKYDDGGNFIEEK